MQEMMTSIVTARIVKQYKNVSRLSTTTNVPLPVTRKKGLFLDLGLSLDFWKFLYEVGMFEDVKEFEQYTDLEKQEARMRYLNAITASIRGSGAVFLKRETKDIFINNFNPNLMLLHAANHDLQVVVDQYAVAQYIAGYLTKNEEGMSQLLKYINDNAENLSKMDLLNQLASILDKHREVSRKQHTE